MTRSTPYGLPSQGSSIQLSSTSSSAGVNASAPSTPKPPARLTAAMTSRQCENAKIGNSMSSLSAIGVRTRTTFLVLFALRDSALAQRGGGIRDRHHVDRVANHVSLHAVLHQ